MGKRIIAILMISVISFSVVANGSKEDSVPAGSAGRIGALLPSLTFDFQSRMAAGIERAAEEFGYGYQEIDYNFDAERELSGIETMIASGVQAYYGIFMSVESDSEKIKENPEVGTISQAMDVEATAFIINDYQALGEQFVDSLDYFITENGLEPGDLASIWLTACEVEDSDFYNAMTTIKSVIEPYCESKGIDYVSDQFAEDNEDASNISEQLMNAYPDLKYVFCFNNGFALVAANEINAGVADSNEYFVFSSEGDSESFRMIASGDSPYHGCAYQDIEANGYATGLQLINWVENGVMEDVVAERILVDVRNVADYLESRAGERT